MNLKRYYEDPSSLHIGTEETHSYFIPFTSAFDAQNLTREQSPLLTSLNGIWKFKYYNSIHDVPNNFWSDNEFFSTCDNIPVPSIWQNYGYDSHQYTNINYPFPFDPPYVPFENPCGIYERTFHIQHMDKEYLLNFEGVDSCFYVWINGEFIGYSQVSHMTSEFNITRHVVDGENKITVLVLKWCDGSYLEDQDKLRTSGIFRDVYILRRPHNRIRDFFIHTTLSDDLSKATLSTTFDFSNDTTTVYASLFAPDGSELFSNHTDENSLSYIIEKPILWNAENPNLYTLILECNGEVIAQKVGIRKIEVKDGIVLLNNTPIKFRGVNRHDSDPVTGPTISIEQAMLDLKLMKEHNVNAIRTSHYPNAPWFPQLCSAYGFYVIGESDIESHGAISRVSKIEWKRKYSYFALDERYEAAILDRVMGNVKRDKNNASILIWSLGNESGYGPNFEKAGRWVKEYDPSRLTHYESSTIIPEGYEADTSMLDLFSRMYASTEDMDAYFSNPENKKPFIQCEYIHAMGNGPGDAEDYQQAFMKYEGACGGFVWEFCDHSVYMGKTPNGRDKYFYGGDFLEYPHDGNFCMDGLVYPDRTPHTGFKEFKNVIRPIRAEIVSLDHLLVRLTNYLDFTNAKDLIDIHYEVLYNGKSASKGIIGAIDILPHRSTELTLPISVREQNYSIILTYVQNKELPLTKAGHILGFDQLLLSNPIVLPNTNPFVTEYDKMVPLTWEENERTVIVTGEIFRYEFNKVSGLFTSLSYKNKEYLQAPMSFNIWRAPTDNDRYVRYEWESAGYNRAKTRVYDTTIDCSNDFVSITCHLSLTPIYLEKILDIKACYIISSTGEIQVKLSCQKNMEMPFLPRFGLLLSLPKQMEKTEYFGYGPYESYEDKHHASYLGLFHTTATQNHEDYIKPQENGSHYACHFVKVLDDFNRGICITTDKPFSFNISPYTQEELTNKKHNFELEESNKTNLAIDYRQSGVGSNSCGPRLKEKYQFNEETFTFQFHLSFQ